jgi:S1-C subfamily serine protease
VVNITTQILRPDFFWGTVPEEGAGSGFVWDDQGRIITNYHVIEDAHSIQVSFAPGVVMPAQVVGADPGNDLAVIQVDALPENVHPLPLADSDALQVGQIVVAIGNPFGRFQRTMTSGIISALDRTINTQGNRVLRRVIQTDADINHGNSGGPLLDSSGRVIGVISAIYSPTGANAGVGLAIPINKAKRVAPVLIAKGRYAHPWLGIEHLGYEITPYLAQRLNLPVDQGLLIAKIYENSPALKAGVRPANDEVILGNYRYLIGGDILTAIDGVPLKSWEDLDAYLQENTEVGQTVTLDIIRDGQPMQIQVQLGEDPSGK